MDALDAVQFLVADVAENYGEAKVESSKSVEVVWKKTSFVSDLAAGVGKHCELAVGTLLA
jgi:hypothetical protein